MKSCPKCNRTFPDEGQKFCTFDGGLLIAPPPPAPPAFDPNATIKATSADLAAMTEKATSRDLPDPNATIADSSFASTVALPRNTAPTGPPPNTAGFGKAAPATPQPPPPPPPAYSQEQTIALPSPGVTTPPVTPPTPPTPSTPLPAPQAAAPAVATAAPKKKSKLPWIIAGVLLFLLLGGGALAGVFFLVVKPRLAGMQAHNQANENRPVVTETNVNANANIQPTPVETPTPKEDNYVPPLGTTAFENSSERLDGKLAEHYFDFNFYYPESWQKDPKTGVPGASSFVRVERRLPPDFTQENFTVGWYTSAGTYDADLPNYPRRVQEFSDSLSKSIAEYRKVSEGPTTVNSMKAYEFRWVGFTKGTDRGDLQLWGRVIFLPTGKEGDTTGATLTMLSTSLAPELSSVDDLGVKGEAPVILESFRFGKKK
ncbi:MAG TPA: hypothetical protein VIX17_13515 [Pyrinomonadaceae bacterium]